MVGAGGGEGGRKEEGGLFIEITKLSNQFEA